VRANANDKSKEEQLGQRVSESSAALWHQMTTETRRTQLTSADDAVFSFSSLVRANANDKSKEEQLGQRVSESSAALWHQMT
jgi:hypothetical protein